jgi:hypothetical protein
LALAGTRYCAKEAPHRVFLHGLPSDSKSMPDRRREMPGTGVTTLINCDNYQKLLVAAAGAVHATTTDARRRNSGGTLLSINSLGIIFRAHL